MEYRAMIRMREATTRAKETKTRVELPEARSIDLPPRDYHPSKAEREEAFDMPGADIETVRSAFFRPIRIAPQKS